MFSLSHINHDQKKEIQELEFSCQIFKEKEIRNIIYEVKGKGEGKKWEGREGKGKGEGSANVTAEKFAFTGTFCSQWGETTK